MQYSIKNMNEQEIKDALVEELKDLTSNSFTILRLMSMIGEISTLSYCRGIEEMTDTAIEHIRNR